MAHMPGTQPEPAAPAAADAAEILRAITRISYLITRARRHDRVRTVAAVPLDRAAVMVLGQLAEAGPARPGELADRLGVEAPHVTRQVQRLQQAGYADRALTPEQVDALWPAIARIVAARRSKVRIDCAMARERTSVPPAGGNGTTSLIGLLG